MIKNEKQYKITRKKLLGFQEEIARIQGGQESLPAKKQLILISLIMMQEQLENEIAAYDLLKTQPSAVLVERSIDELPNLLIEFKINSGLTQKEFSKKIGMKEQQLQRYEADNFKSISFKNLLKILHSIGLEIKIKGSVIGNITNRQSGQNESIA
jgi:DNA-binding Xre family transcriptional regulator